MSEEVDGTSSTEGVEQYAIGISFGNSNSSIAHLSAVRLSSMAYGQSCSMLIRPCDRMAKQKSLRMRKEVNLLPLDQ